MHKALPRHEYGGSEFDDSTSDALSTQMRMFAAE